MREASGTRDAIPRRAFLAGAGAVTAIGAVLVPAAPSHTPLVEWPVDLRERWIEMITARSRIDIGQPRVRTHLEAMDAEVRTYLDSAADAADGTDIFARFPVDGEDSGAFSNSATWLALMARAWATPGSEFSDSQQVLETVLDGTEQLLAYGYHEGAETYDNWWDWEIGAARPLADLMCLLRDELPGSVLQDAGAAIRYFNPDPTYSELMNYPTTASNRVSAVRSALVAAIAEDDTARIRECVGILPSTWEIVDRLDGFYADGGFIQHIDIPYTGNYGSDLLRNLAPMLSLLHGTDYDVEGREQVWDLIDSAFLPVMVNGHVLDGVRGRAVGRMRSNGSVTGRGLVGAIAEIARTAPPARSQHWFDLIGWWASENPTVDLLAGGDLPGAAALQPIAERRVKEVEGPPSTYFASMDRLVHRAGSWTAAVSMCSDRIAAFEGTEAENSWGLLTGNSMRYLFIGDDPAPFDDYFWATLDYSRPPGTTNHRVAFEPMITRGGTDNVPDNEWAGGLLDGRLSVTAMHQSGLDDEAPGCRRFSVAGPDSIVELVSDIHSDFHAFTTVENRMFPEGAPATLVVDGEEIHDPTTLPDARWAHIQEVGGYVLLRPGTVTAGVTRRVGSTVRVERDVEAIPRDQRVDREWAALDLHHSGPEGAAWMLLPAASLEATRDLAEQLLAGEHPTQVVRNDGTAQIVSLGPASRAAAVWKPVMFDAADGVRIDCSQPLLISIAQEEGRISLRLTEPTQKLRQITVTLSGTWSLDEVEEISTGNVTVRDTGSGTRVSARTQSRGGRAFTVHLRTA